MATSGTTGDPRGVVLTHEGIQSGVRASSDRLEIDPSSDWWISCLPLAHVGGLSVVIRSIETGTRLTIFERFDTQDV
ncbi:MAG TPA: AMP-binding protein, partial [Acidimicrobiales bacterium]|nr:AMP-binding protein [Acidimicrobiales bacterium]